MSNLSKREKYFAIMCFILLSGYLFYTVFFKPVITKIVDKKNVIEAKNADYDKIQKVKTTNESIKKKIEDYKKILPEKIVLIPRDERNPEVEYNYNDIAKTNGMVIKSLSYGTATAYLTMAETAALANQATPVVDPTAENLSELANNSAGIGTQHFKVIPVTVKVTGDSDKVFDFIKTIETDTRITQILNLKLSLEKSEEVSDKNNLNSTITTNYFYSTSNVPEEPNYDKIKDANASKDNLFK